ncbi:hypothetical protein LMH87_003504 [Akanthomyces muscarius]|uniref:Uncharacterized protein n=1 Tax=Akanthomyces muscarius TaxID=2231603 RepID=A0A9W8UH53_AKAMU|nr:hypothetical protein LMH87_003504 [Akanthomyces muscarius]KAJ4144629.1 hypothetical protein LMH87_003504 [Akanthomyces muscarius]
MELYAVGQNGWSQLEFRADQPTSQDDVFELIKIASGTTIEKPISSIISTIVNIDGHFRVAHGRRLRHYLILRAALTVSTANGCHMSVTDNGNGLSIQESLRGYPPLEVAVHPPVKQIAASATGFVILHENGMVSTTGDERFPAMLGRVVTEHKPARHPARVADLDHLLDHDPIQHIAAAGYAVAALTRSGDVYMWGQHPPSRTGEQPFFPNLSDISSYTEIGGGKDIQDVALGEAHAIALTRQGELYVVGSNRSGQLGIPAIASTNQWTHLAFNPPNGFRVTGVAAGPNTSFVLVSANPAH